MKNSISTKIKAILEEEGECNGDNSAIGNCYTNRKDYNIS